MGIIIIESLRFIGVLALFVVMAFVAVAAGA